MGKTVTIYLTDKERKLIDEICETQGCNTHSVVKAGIQLFLCKAIKRKLLPKQPTVEVKKKPKRESSSLIDRLLGLDE